MNFGRRYVAYSLAGISIVLTLLLAYPDINRSKAKARVVTVPTADVRVVTTDTAEETVTLSPANLKTWEHYYHWEPRETHCGPEPENIPGSIVAGFKQSEGCPGGSHTVYRGTVWFDLSAIVSKAPPLHVAVKSAKLHFNQSGECPGELLIGSADWLKGYPANELVPGDPSPFATLPSGSRTSALLGGLLAKPCGACSIDVEPIVNNWLRGEEHGGYANYGFLFKGMREDDVYYGDSYSCVSRYRDFSLALTYTYDKAPDSYPLVCRGTDAFKVDVVGPAGSKGVGFTFIPGTGPAKDGLRPGQCSWLDRAMRPGEPAKLAQPIEKAVDWPKELNSSDSYWTFNVYNAGDQFQASGAERSKKLGIDVAKPGGSIPGGDKFAVARTNFALASQSATANPSTILGPGWEASGAINGDRAGINWGSGGGWADGTSGIFPDSLEVDFKGSHTIDQINVYTLQDNFKIPTDPGDPSAMLPFNTFGLTAFEVQVWDGSAWVTVGSVSTGDKKYVGREFHFKAVTTNKIRVLTSAAADNGYSRITEVEAWGTK